MDVDKMLICANNLFGKMNSELGDIVRLIKAELQKRRWSQAQLAEALGRSGGWLSHIMHSKRRFTLQTLFDIARILNINPASLISRDSENEPSSKMGLDEYIKNVVREELSKYNKKEG